MVSIFFIGARDGTFFLLSFLTNSKLPTSKTAQVICFCFLALGSPEDQLIADSGSNRLGAGLAGPCFRCGECDRDFESKSFLEAHLDQGAISFKITEA